jgi:hypothetical protein
VLERIQESPTGRQFGISGHLPPSQAVSQVTENQRKSLIRRLRASQRVSVQRKNLMVFLMVSGGGSWR